VVLGAGGAGAVGPNTLFLATLGVFVLPIVEDTGFSRTTVTAGYSVAAVGMTIGLLVVGRLVDRYAVRHLVVPAFLLFAVSLGSIGAMPPVAPLHLALCSLVGFFGAGTAVPVARAVVTWFDNSRALAIGVVTAVISAGAALAPLAAGALVDRIGWRLAYAAMAVVSAVVSVSLVLAFVRARAERHVRGRLVAEAPVGGRRVSLDLPGLTSREALRTREFWYVACGLGLAGVVVVGLQVHLVPMMTDRGLPADEAELLLVVFGLASLVGRLLGGFVIDRVHASVVGPVVMLAPIAGMLLLHPPFSSAVVAVALIGVAFGVEGDLLPLLISRYLGTRAFGRILAAVQAAFLLGSAGGPLLLGLGHDALGSYEPVFPVLMAALVVGAILVGSLGRYRYPAVSGFDRLAALDELAAAEVLSDLAEHPGPALDPRPARTV
jgi:predicted MFS family arabinose efflux permease